MYVSKTLLLEKSKLETLNIEALKWFSRTVKLSINDDFLSDNNDDDNDNDYNKNTNKNDNKPAMIIVHGAGSFGHHTAKKYGLRGETSPPPNNGMKLKKDMITGIAKTRLRYVA
jgi:predicted alpha/beta-fold hydrolase